MSDVVHELLATEAALDKLGARDISADEASQLPRNKHVVVRKPRSGPSEKRPWMVGITDGGRIVRTPSVTFLEGRYERRSMDS